jgi:phosphonoacetaldehyde hydrolase
MGMQKRAHIAKMLEPYPHQPEDVDTIYARFEPALFDVLELYTDPLPGVITTVGELGEMGLSVGSTTGYTQAMMDVVLPLAKKKGYAPDCLVCPDDVGNTGRPFPYMLWRNLEKLGTRCISEVIKVGDTIADIQEGNNAGCLSVGVLEGSSVVGLTSSEVAQLGPGDLLPVFTKAEQLFFEAGADYVLRNITELPSLITSLHQSLEA